MKQHFWHIIALSIILVLSNVTSAAQSDTATVHPVKVSLITFYPGNEVFEVFGHSEILLSDSTGDYFINYGVFDFNSPGFVTRYIMGETDYLCAIMPPNMDGGIKEGRKRVKQDLNLTPEQAKKVWDILVWNVQPANRVYRYRHFSDNCSTRPRDVIETALGHELDYNQCNYIVGKTLRQVMSHYTRNYPWEQFGIDLALGAVCDTIIDARTHTFVPLFLMHALDSATVVSNGKTEPLVSNSTVITPGNDNGIVASPTPWYLTPMFFALLLFTITIVITLHDWRKSSPSNRERTKVVKSINKGISRWYDTILFTIAGLAGCLIFFIEFISTHEAVMPNYNILWLHPLLLLLAILPWIKKASQLLKWCHFVNLALIATMAVVWLSGLQAPNAAFIPIIAALAIRSLLNVIKLR